MFALQSDRGAERLDEIDGIELCASCGTSGRAGGSGLRPIHGSRHMLLRAIAHVAGQGSGRAVRPEIRDRTYGELRIPPVMNRSASDLAWRWMRPVFPDGLFAVVGR